MPESLSARILPNFTSCKSPTVARARRRSVAVAATLFWLISAGTAVAEPFRITSGSFRFSSGPAEVNVSGPDFSLFSGETGTDEFGIPGLAFEGADPFAKTLPLSGHVVFDSSGRLTVTDGSVVAGVLFDVFFDAGSADTAVGACPASLFTFVCTVATGPFKMTGRLVALGPSGERIFERALTGGGIATVGFFDLAGGRPSPFAEYRFEAAAPTPEPGTLLLVLCGVLGLRSKFRTPKLRRSGDSV
jgi:hypothetical protein